MVCTCEYCSKIFDQEEIGGVVVIRWQSSISRHMGTYLFFSLLVFIQRLLKHLPEDKWANSLWAGWEESSRTLWAQCRQQFPLDVCNKWKWRPCDAVGCLHHSLQSFVVCDRAVSCTIWWHHWSGGRKSHGGESSAGQSQRAGFSLVSLERRSVGGLTLF